jgi:hypothetical protein
VATGFSQARSRIVSRAKVTGPALSTSQITDNVLSNSFGSPTGLTPSPQAKQVKRKAEPEDLFSALSNTSSNVIDFNEKVHVRFLYV